MRSRVFWRILATLMVASLLVAAWIAGSHHKPVMIGHPHAHCTPYFAGIAGERCS
jgi:hypothetical protein